MKVCSFVEAGNGFVSTPKRYRSRWSTSVTAIIWHLISITQLRHTNFILCLGYRGDLIKEYSSTTTWLSNDFSFGKR